MKKVYMINESQLLIITILNFNNNNYFKESHK